MDGGDWVFKKCYLQKEAAGALGAGFVVGRLLF